MKQIRLTAILIIGQYTIGLICVNNLLCDILKCRDISLDTILVGILIIGITTAAVTGIGSLEKMFSKHMVFLEMDTRENDINHYQEELNLIQHEVLRDIQMIRLLGEEEKYKEVEKYLS